LSHCRHESHERPTTKRTHDGREGFDLDGTREQNCIFREAAREGASRLLEHYAMCSVQGADSRRALLCPGISDFDQALSTRIAIMRHDEANTVENTGAIPAKMTSPGARIFWTAVILTGIGAGIGAAALTSLLYYVQHLLWPPSSLDLVSAAELASSWHHIWV